jgi:hypothetical protein
MQISEVMQSNVQRREMLHERLLSARVRRAVHGQPWRMSAGPTDAGGWLAPLSAWSGKVTSLVGDEARLNRHRG